MIGECEMQLHLQQYFSSEQECTFKVTMVVSTYCDLASFGKQSQSAGEFL